MHTYIHVCIHTCTFLLHAELTCQIFALREGGVSHFCCVGNWSARFLLVWNWSATLLLRAELECKIFALCGTGVPCVILIAIAR